MNDDGNRGGAGEAGGGGRWGRHWRRAGQGGGGGWLRGPVVECLRLFSCLIALHRPSPLLVTVSAARVSGSGFKYDVTSQITPVATNINPRARDSGSRGSNP